MYHGILVDQEFENPNFPERFKIFSTKQDGSWKIYGIEIDDADVQGAIKEIQKNMKSDQPWYAHLYNDEELIVIFKNKIFNVKPYKSTWKEIIEYGKAFNIPEKQLDFWPNRFQDEEHYFNKS